MLHPAGGVDGIEALKEQDQLRQARFVDVAGDLVVVAVETQFGGGLDPVFSVADSEAGP